MFEQFKENLSLARENAKTAREGLRAGHAAWRNAPSNKRAIWLLVPTAMAISAVAGYLSVRWYYEVAGVLALVIGSWMLGAIRRKLQ